MCGKTQSLRCDREHKGPTATQGVCRCVCGHIYESEFLPVSTSANTCFSFVVFSEDFQSVLLGEIIKAIIEVQPVPP